MTETKRPHDITEFAAMSDRELWFMERPAQKYCSEHANAEKIAFDAEIKKREEAARQCGETGPPARRRDSIQSD